MHPKKILYFDMDGVLVDFESGIRSTPPQELAHYAGRLDEVPGIFSRMLPLPGAIEAATLLAAHFDVYVLSTASWHNPSAWHDKLCWIHRYFGAHEESIFYKRLILSHQKHLNAGHYLIDDRLKNGADRFTGQHIHFGTPAFPHWEAVTHYLLQQVQ